MTAPGFRPDQASTKVCPFPLQQAVSFWEERRSGRESLLSEGSEISKAGKEGPGREQYGLEEGTARAWEAL